MVPRRMASSKPAPSDPAPPSGADDKKPDSWLPATRRAAGQSEWSWRASGLLLTMRPHQWVKNVFVLAPVVFAKEILDPQLMMRAGRAFVIFCLLASAVYTINDLADAASDRQHPLKRHRPIACGRVSRVAARVLAAVLIALALALASTGAAAVLAVAAIYFAMNLAYSIKLKHVAYVDVGIIAAGFVLRVMAGGYATQIQVSRYLLVCTALLALFLGFGKRRHELTGASVSAASKQRASLEAYSAKGLDVVLAGTGFLTIVTYLLYTLAEHTEAFFRSDALWLTTAFVVLGVWRFLHLVRHRPKAESPTQEMLRDGPFVGIVLLWVMVMMLIVYNLRPGQ